MRRILPLSILLLALSSCASQRMALDGAVTVLKCGGPGGERNFSACSWRKTSVFRKGFWRRPAAKKPAAPKVK